MLVQNLSSYALLSVTSMNINQNVFVKWANPVKMIGFNVS